MFREITAAFGSERPWHHSSSTRSMAGRKRCFCSSVPNLTVYRRRRSLAEERDPRRRVHTRVFLVEDHLLREVGHASAVGDRPRRPDPAVAAEDPFPLQPDVPDRLVGRPPPGPTPAYSPLRSSRSRAHLLAEFRLGGSLGEIHDGWTLLDRPVSFPGGRRHGTRHVSGPVTMSRSSVRGCSGSNDGGGARAVGVHRRARSGCGWSGRGLRELVRARALRQRRQAAPSRRGRHPAPIRNGPPGAFFSSFLAHGRAARVGRRRAVCTRSSTRSASMPGGARARCATTARARCIRTAP